MFRPWQRAAKSADWERTFTLVGWFFPNYSMTFGDKTKLLDVIQKVILWAIILSKKNLKIFKTVAFRGDFVKKLKSSSFLNFQLLWTNKYIIRKGLARETRFWNQILNFLNNKNFVYFENFHYWENLKFDFRILFLLPNPFKWFICLSKKKI